MKSMNDLFSFFKKEISKHVYFKDFKEKLSIVDLFGQRIDLTYKNQANFKTHYGAIYTLLVFIIIILQIIAGYKDMTYRMNPIINKMDIDSTKIEKINLMNENITIAFAINTQDRKVHLSKDKVFSYEGKLISRSKNETLDRFSSFVIPFKNCSINQFNSFEKLYDNFFLKNAMCFPEKKTSNFSLDIFSNPEEFTENYFKLKIRVCENKALLSKDCFLSEEYIKEILPTLNLNLYIIHQYFDGIDTSNPIKRRLSFMTFNLEEELFLKTKYYLYFTKNFLTDYSDLFSAFAEPKTVDFIGFSNKDVISLVKFDREENPNFIEIYFRLDNIPIRYIRKYANLFDLIANIGGLFNALFIIGTIIFGLINRILFETKIINDHFNIYDINKDCDNFINSVRLKENNQINEQFKNMNKLNFNDKKISGEKEKFLEKLTLNSKLNIIELKSNLVKTTITPLDNIKNGKLDNQKLSKNNAKNEYSFDNLKDKNSNSDLKFSDDLLTKDKNLSKIKDFYIVRRMSFDADTKNNLTIFPFRKIDKKLFNDYEEFLDNSNRVNHYRFKFNLKDIIKNLIPIRNRIQEKKNDFFNLCKAIIDDYLDLNSIVPLIQEFKVSRLMLFNKEELELIQNYKKPIIKVTERNHHLNYRITNEEYLKIYQFEGPINLMTNKKEDKNHVEICNLEIK